MSVFADEFPGLNAGAKLISAIAALPGTGGIVDATRLYGPQKIEDIIHVDKPVRLLLGVTDYESSISPAFEIRSNFSVAGLGRETSSILVANGGTLFKTFRYMAC